MSDELIGPGTVSIKFGKGYEAPLFVARGTVQEMGAQLIEAFGLFGQVTDQNTLADITALASAVAGGLQLAHQPKENGGLGGQPTNQGGASSAQSWGSQPRGQNSQGDAQTNQAPQGGQGGGPGGACNHGDRIWKSFNRKSDGKLVKGWFCPQNVNDCKPEWVN